MEYSGCKLYRDDLHGARLRIRFPRLPRSSDVRNSWKMGTSGIDGEALMLTLSHGASSAALIGLAQQGKGGDISGAELPFRVTAIMVQSTFAVI